MDGMTQTEYARVKGMTPAAVNQKIKAGTIGWNGKHGKACRVWELEEEAEESKGLAIAKLEKLRVDIELQRQRIRDNREAMWREFAEAAGEDYQKAFAPLSAWLTELRLPEEKLSALRKKVEECTREYIALLDRRWEDHEEQEEES